ncbi:hypothetical protein [Wukongibacter sp. M2B1]|uniref:hypothetical protein n=1 Tax=Wukongibacter sp. M2B1 TaxID=3088895 RepID=UPI003D799619
MSVEFIGREIRYSFSANDQEVTELKGKIKLKNHSNKKREFYLAIDNPTDNIKSKFFVLILGN